MPAQDMMDVLYVLGDTAFLFTECVEARDVAAREVRIVYDSSLLALGTAELKVLAEVLSRAARAEVITPMFLPRRGNYLILRPGVLCNRRLDITEL